MAIANDKKKRDDQETVFTPSSVTYESPVAAPAQLGPVGANPTPTPDGRSRTSGPHSAVASGVKRPAAPEPVTAYGAGQAVRGSIGQAIANGVVAPAKKLLAPVAASYAAAGQFGRGLLGMEGVSA